MWASLTWGRESQQPDTVARATRAKLLLGKKSKKWNAEGRWTELSGGSRSERAVAFLSYIFPLMKHSASEASPGCLPQQLTHSQSFRSLLSGGTPQVDPDVFHKCQHDNENSWHLLNFYYEKHSTKPPYLILKTTLCVSLLFFFILQVRTPRGEELKGDMPRLTQPGVPLTPEPGISVTISERNSL